MEKKYNPPEANTQEWLRGQRVHLFFKFLPVEQVQAKIASTIGVKKADKNSRDGKKYFSKSLTRDTPPACLV